MQHGKIKEKSNMQGGIKKIWKTAGVWKYTIRRGMAELLAGDLYSGFLQQQHICEF